MSNTLFTSRKLNTKGIEQAHRIEQVFTDLLDELMDMLPCGRELSIVQTKLEEASMFAKKALSLDEANRYVAPEPPAKKSYVIEFWHSSNKRWERSRSRSITLGSRPSLQLCTFDSLENAEREANAQRDKYSMNYRPKEVGASTEKYIVEVFSNLSYKWQRSTNKHSNSGVSLSNMLFSSEAEATAEAKYQQEKSDMLYRATELK